MATTIDCITALFCQVDDHLAGLTKHPDAPNPLKPAPEEESHSRR